MKSIKREVRLNTLVIRDAYFTPISYSHIRNFDLFWQNESFSLWMRERLR